MWLEGGNRFPGPKGDMLVGGMSGQRLVRLRLDGPKVIEDETLFRGIGRVRDARKDPAENPERGIIYPAARRLLFLTVEGA